MSEEKKQEPIKLSPEQIAVIEKLLNGNFDPAPLALEIDAQSFLLQSSEYGTNRKHIIQTDSYNDAVKFQQIDVTEKYQQRVDFSNDEIPALIAGLLHWHLRQHDTSGLDKDLEDNPFL